MMDFPLAQLLGRDDDWVRQFRNLIEADTSEILIWDHTRFEPCAVFLGNPCDCGMPDDSPIGSHWAGVVVWTDLEFWFPCDDPFHKGCGFFLWTLCLETAAFHRRNLEDGEEKHDRWDFVIVDRPAIEENRLAGIARGWLEQWVPQLAAKPIREVSYEESRRIWARFEEMHPDAEEEDVMRVCQQRLLEIESGTAELVSFDEIHDRSSELGNGGADDS
jgi:hypothetical protein